MDEQTPSSLDTAPPAGSSTEAVPTDALPPDGAFQPALDLIQAGGPVVVILLVLSVAALAILIVKLMQFASLRVGARGFIEPALKQWRAGHGGDALALLARQRSPIARALEVAIRGQDRKADETLLREEVARIATSHLEGLRTYLRPLELIAALSPLLGLFGTVLGMIEAFQQLEQSGSQVDPAILSGGIWEALLTTAAGLAVAMPVVAVLGWLERSIERLGLDLEDAVTRVFTMPLAQAHEVVEPMPLRGSRLHHAP